jgi:integrase
MATVTKRNKAYLITVSDGFDIHGKRKKQFLTWKIPENMTESRAKKEAQRQAILFEEQCKGGRQVTATIKFEAFAEEYFQMVTSLNKLKVGTISNYRNYSKRVFSKIGHLRLDKITTTHIQRIVNEMAEGGRRDKYKNKPLSPKTIRNHVAFISTVFTYAKKRKILSYNPCEDVELPQDNADEQGMHTIEEVQQIMGWLYSDPKKTQYAVFYTLAIYTGFRRGEILGLEFSDFDFERGIVTVNRQSKYDTQEKIYTDTPKTKKSLRSIKLPPEIIDIVQGYKQKQTAYIESVGDKWVTKIKGLGGKLVDNDRLFTQDLGLPMHPNTPNTYFERLCQRKGVEYHSVHSLRRFNASTQIFAGVDIRTVSSNLFSRIAWQYTVKCERVRFTVKLIETLFKFKAHFQKFC